MNRTDIEWCWNHNGTPGFTSNPITGCWGPGGSEEKPNRCKWCYAWRIAKKTKQMVKASLRTWAGQTQPSYDDDPFKPAFHPHELGHLRARRKPATIFIGSMSDVWGDWIPASWLNAILEIVRERPQHTFIFLTKNPARYLNFSPFPANVMLGVTAINQKMADRALFYLSQVEAPVKVLSCEPLLGEIALPKYPPIDWLIIGALSLGDGKTRQPHPNWMDVLLNGADRAKVPVFVKDNLDWETIYWDHPRRREFPAMPQLERERQHLEQPALF